MYKKVDFQITYRGIPTNNVITDLLKISKNLLRLQMKLKILAEVLVKF